MSRSTPGPSFAIASSPTFANTNTFPTSGTPYRARASSVKTRRM